MYNRFYHKNVICISIHYFYICGVGNSSLCLDNSHFFKILYTSSTHFLNSHSSSHHLSPCPRHGSRPQKLHQPLAFWGLSIYVKIYSGVRYTPNRAQRPRFGLLLLLSAPSQLRSQSLTLLTITSST